MKPLEVVFTVNPSGGKYTAKLCYTCKTPEDIRCAKNALSEWLENYGQQLPSALEADVTPADAPKSKAEIYKIIDRALSETKESGNWHQYCFTEGLIKMAYFSGATSEADYSRLTDHLESLKGWCSYEKTMQGVAVAKPVKVD